MQRVAEALENIASEVRVFEWDDAVEKGDAADHPAVKDGSSTPEAVRELLDEMTAAPLWESEEASGHDGGRRGATRGAHGIFTARDLMARELPPVRWTVPDILPEGLCLLAGKPKLGKSWLALGLAVAVSSGGVALGTKHVEQGEALYLGLEDNERRLQKRLGKILAGGDVPEGLHLATSWPRMDDGGAEALDEWVKAHPDLGLVVVDVLKRVRPRASKYQSIYDADYEAIEVMQGLAAKYGMSFLVVHHTRKQAAGDPLDEISGSLGLSGGADGIMVLKRDRGRGDAYLHVDGRDIEEPAELALVWDADTVGWTLAGDADDFRMSRERAEALRTLEETGEPMTPTEVADVLGKTVGSVKKLLWSMSKDGQVSASDGRYSPVTRNLGNSVTEAVIEKGVAGNPAGNPIRLSEPFTDAQNL